MSPLPPGGGDDIDVEDELAVADESLTSGITDVVNSDDEESHDYSDVGYALLPSSEAHEPISESVDLTVVPAGDFQLSCDTARQCDETVHPTQMLSYPNSDVDETRQLRSASTHSTRNSIFMDQELIEKIRTAMAGFTLPSCCHPDWANVVLEAEWKAQLVSQINKSN
jgi:hypothetical protein